MEAREACRLRNLAQAAAIAAGLLREDAAQMGNLAETHRQIAGILEHMEQELLELSRGCRAVEEEI